MDELLTACKKYKFPLKRTELNEMVERNDKKRFFFNATGTRIGANQGHSVQVDLWSLVSGADSTRVLIATQISLLKILNVKNSSKH